VREKNRNNRNPESSRSLRVTLQSQVIKGEEGRKLFPEEREVRNGEAETAMKQVWIRAELGLSTKDGSMESRARGGKN